MSRQDVMTTDLTFTGTGASRRIRGDFSNATQANRTLFQSSVTNGNTEIGIMPNGTGRGVWYEAFNTNDPANSGYFFTGIDANLAYLASSRLGTGAYLPLSFNVGGAERMRIATDGTITIPGNLTVSGTLTSATITNSGTISTAAINTADWLRMSSGQNGIFNGVQGYGVYFLPQPAIYPSGDIIVGRTGTETLSNKTMVDPQWRGISGFVVNGNDLTNYMFYYTTGTVTLPAASAGKIRFIKAWAGPVTVNSAGTNLMPPGSQSSIVSSFVLANGDSVTMIADGTYWWTV